MAQLRTLNGDYKTPYRIVVFARKYCPVKRTKRLTTIEISSCAWHDWTPTQHYQEARLPNAGSFLYPGIYAARRAAMQAFEDSSVHQVQVRTNQDRKLYLWNRHANGSITGYRPEDN